MAVSAEVLLISSIINTGDFQTALAEGASEELFTTCPDEWDWVSRYFRRNKRCPSMNAFKIAFPKFRIKDVDDVKHYVNEVRIERTRLALTEHLRDQADMLAQGDVQGACDLAQRGIVKIAAGIGTVQDHDILNDWKTTYNTVKARKLRTEDFGMAGIATGFETVDYHTGGIQPGQLWIVGARLGQGKTWTLMNMACAALMNDHKAYFAALEMSKDEVAFRIHNFLSSSIGMQVFQSQQLSQGKDFDLKEYRKFLAEIPKRVKGQLVVSDKRNIGAADIAAAFERTHPDAFYLDYLTLARMKGDGGWQDIGNFTKELKTLAGEYNVAIAAAAQLNRSGAENSKEPPGAETIAQADAIGQDADAVITLMKKSDRVTMFKMAKYRHGRDGFMWYANIDLKNGVFEEVSKNRALDIIDQDADRRDKELESERTPIKRKTSAQKSQIASIQQEALVGAGKRKMPLKRRTR
ncbi:DnaB-like dsDNA helicase [Gordonia phage Hanem]|nr:DnaB-like dsDNA helicase [Gordonia phage Hanem]